MSIFQGNTVKTDLDWPYFDIELKIQQKQQV